MVLRALQCTLAVPTVFLIIYEFLAHYSNCGYSPKEFHAHKVILKLLSTCFLVCSCLHYLFEGFRFTVWISSFQVSNRAATMIWYVTVYLTVITVLNRGKPCVSNVDLWHSVPSRFCCPVAQDIFMYICFGIQYNLCAMVCVTQ